MPTHTIPRLRIPLLGILSLFTSTVAATALEEPTHPGKAETTMRCLICHGDAQTGQQRLAPPMVMVKRHYQNLNQAEFEKAVLAWVKKPDANKSKMPGAIRRFNLMPTFPIPEPEIKLIANYIYKTDFTFPRNCGQGNGQGDKGSKGKKATQECDQDNCANGKGRPKKGEASPPCQ